MAGNVIFKVFERDRTRETEQSRFGGYLVDAVYCPARAVYGRHVEEASKIPLAHIGQGQPYGVKRGRKVDRQRRIPVFRQKIHDRREMAHDGVVNENVYGAKAFQRGFDEARYRARVADIRLMVRNGHAGAALEFATHRFNTTMWLDAIEHDAAARLCQAFGNRETQASGGAGHDRHATMQRCL